MLVRIVFELSAQQKLSVAIYQSWSDSETTFVCDLSLGDDQESPDLEPVQLVDDQESPDLEPVQLGDDQESPDLEPVQLGDIPGILLLQAQQRQTNKKASKLVEEVVD